MIAQTNNLSRQSFAQLTLDQVSSSGTSLIVPKFQISASVLKSSKRQIAQQTMTNNKQQQATKNKQQQAKNDKQLQTTEDEQRQKNKKKLNNNKQ